MIYVREYDSPTWYCITIEEWERREEKAGPVSAFAETRKTNPNLNW